MVSAQGVSDLLMSFRAVTDTSFKSFNIDERHEASEALCGIYSRVMNLWHIFSDDLKLEISINKEKICLSQNPKHDSEIELQRSVKRLKSSHQISGRKRQWGRN